MSIWELIIWGAGIALGGLIVYLVVFGMFIFPWLDKYVDQRATKVYENLRYWESEIERRRTSSDADPTARS